MASPAKRAKVNKTKNFFVKQNQKGGSNFLKAGDKGYLVTFNFKASDSKREIYKLLNEYHQQYYGTKEGSKQVEESKGSDEEEDIEDELSKAIDDTKQENVKKTNKFNAVETGANGLIFIKASIDEYHELGERIIRDLLGQDKKTKFTNRLIPVDKVCKANIKDMTNAAGELFDQHFLKEPSTFAIIFNKRLNNDSERDEVIKELAALVSQKNVLNKVDLKNAKKTILVEVIKGLCCISVINDYIPLKKYNLNELSTKPAETEKVAVDAVDEEKSEKAEDTGTAE